MATTDGRFSSGCLVVSLLGLVTSSCTREATALVVVVSEDARVAAVATKVEIEVQRGGTTRFSRTYPGEVRGTLTLERNEDAAGGDVIVIRVEGQDAASHEKVSRQARLGFVDEKTKLLRMPLRGQCLGVSCGTGTTCLDDGTCGSDAVDAGSLPDFVSNGDALAGSSGVAGAGGIAGSAGSAGTAGTSGSGGNSGSAGTGGGTVEGTVSVGDARACALNEGIPYCWGKAGDIVGQYAYPQYPALFSTPVRITALESVAAGAEIHAVATKSGHACAVVGDTRRLVCWGSNFAGQTGQPTSTFEPPTLVPGVTGVEQVSLLTDATCVRLSTPGENIRCWGSNQSQVLGPNDPTPGPTPQTIPGVMDAPVLRTAKAFACAMTGGQVTCWGSGSSLVYMRKTLAFSNVVDIATGGVFAPAVYAIDADGKVTWSAQSLDDPYDWSDPADVVDANGVALGPVSRIVASRTLCGVSLDKTHLRCIDSAADHPAAMQTYDVSPRTIVDASVGYSLESTFSSICVRLDDGSTRCMGYNDAGQLGIGMKHDYPSPAPVTTNPASFHLWIGGNISALMEDDSRIVRAWGTSGGFFPDGLPHAFTTLNGGVGLLEVGSGGYIRYDLQGTRLFMGNSTSKVELANDTKIETPTDLFGQGLLFTDAWPASALDLGLSPTTPSFVRAYLESGQSEGSGLLGAVQTDSHGAYVDVGTPLAEISYVAHEYNINNHVCVRGVNGGVWCWGENTSGQVGNGSTTSPVTAPTQVIPAGGATAICTGQRYSCAVMASPGGSPGVKCWGDNISHAADYTQPFSVHVVVPTPILGVPQVDGVTCGDSFVCAWNSSTAYCWGDNTHGQLGDSTVPTTTAPSSLVTVMLDGSTDAIQQLAAGAQHVCARQASGKVRCWGSSSGGQCGQDNTAIVTNATTVVFEP